MEMSNSLQILNLPLSRSGVDRAAHVRNDPQALDLAWSTGSIIHFNGEGFLTELDESEGSEKLAFLRADQISGVGEKIFLGIGEGDGRNYFLWCSPANISLEGSSVEGIELTENYKTLREISAGLSSLEIGLAVNAQALALWHHKNPFCSYCAEATYPALAGSIRRCPNGHEHYPRTDTAIIVLVKDSNDRILLGRQGTWPEHRFSTFAGFVEAGESFEQCVIREVQEEAGVHVADIHYLGSQPWPFPQSLMVAFEARILDPENARADGTEIVEIRWFSRDELYAAITEGTLLLPPSISVARAMIQAWYGNDRTALPGAETWRS